MLAKPEFLFQKWPPAVYGEIYKDNSETIKSYMVKIWPWQTFLKIKFSV